jgi:hypothetical protein
MTCVKLRHIVEVGEKEHRRGACPSTTDWFVSVPLVVGLYSEGRGTYGKVEYTPMAHRLTRPKPTGGKFTEGVT